MTQPQLAKVLKPARRGKEKDLLYLGFPAGEPKTGAPLFTHIVLENSSICKREPKGGEKEKFEGRDGRVECRTVR